MTAASGTARGEARVRVTAAHTEDRLGDRRSITAAELGAAGYPLTFYVKT